MNWVDLALLFLAVTGITLIWTAPTEPSYSLSIDESTEATPNEVTQFVNLSTDAQREFLDVLQTGERTGTESPALSNGFIRYKGELFRVYRSVGESSIFSLLQPIGGGGIVVVSGLGLIGRRVWQRKS